MGSSSYNSLLDIQRAAEGGAGVGASEQSLL